MEHLLYISDHYSARIWTLGTPLMLSLSRLTGEYIPAISLIPLEIVFNKPQPSLFLHLQDSNTQNVVILLLQEVKCDIIF
jgi:hypothetical protein